MLVAMEVLGPRATYCVVEDSSDGEEESFPLVTVVRSRQARNPRIWPRCWKTRCCDVQVVCR